MRNRPRRAFTLIELLVVMAIIMVLAGLSFVVISAVIRKAQVTRAAAMLQQIQGALERYRAEFSAYPPDTGDWNEAVSDPFAIHRYLARDLVHPATGERVQACLGLDDTDFAPLDAEGLGALRDPWGNPYQLDSLHMRLVAGEPQRTGEPYLPSRPATERTREYKIVSFGPDGVSADYPFDQDPPDPRAADDVKSW